MIVKSVKTPVLFLAALLTVGGGRSGFAADPIAGKAVFSTQCAICHAVEPGLKKLGPTLSGIVGRKTGAVEGFRYSPANQNANFVWDEPTLDKYLLSPKGVIPGTTMVYAGLKDDTKRADLVAYLATLK